MKIYHEGPWSYEEHNPIIWKDHVPLVLQHRCHNKLCVEHTHLYWGTDGSNFETDKCQIASHIILENGHVVQLCTHYPCCLTPKFVTSCGAAQLLSQAYSVQIEYVR